MSRGENDGIDGRLDVRLDTSGNGPRLRIEDRRTGDVIYLDPLELECLTRVPDGELSRYLPDSP